MTKIQNVGNISTSEFLCHHMLKIDNWGIDCHCDPFSAFHPPPSFSPTHTTVCFAPVCFPSLKRLPWKPIVLPGSQHIPRAHVQGQLDTHSHNTHAFSDSGLEIDCALSLLHKTVFTPASVDEAARVESPAKSRTWPQQQFATCCLPRKFTFSSLCFCFALLTCSVATEVWNYKEYDMRETDNGCVHHNYDVYHGKVNALSCYIFLYFHITQSNQRLMSFTVFSLKNVSTFLL